MWCDGRFEVVDMDGRRVDKVMIHPPSGIVIQKKLTNLRNSQLINTAIYAAFGTLKTR